MGLPKRRLSRRALLAGLAASVHLGAQPAKGSPFPADWKQYSDPVTEFPVIRLTDPAYASYLPAYYQQAVAERGGFLLFSSRRPGRLEAFRMDLKTGECRQLTDAAALDASSLTLLPGESGFCFFDGPSLRLATFSKPREGEVYTVPEGWERCPGGSVSGDGAFALFGERRPGGSRLRLAGLLRGAARTIVETPWDLSHPLARPRRAQALYRQGDEALWLVNTDGRENRRLSLAPGRVGPANWAADGRTLLYLHLPADPARLSAIREYAPDRDADELVAETSQFAHFAFNRDSSVFVGASRNTASPCILLLLRVGRHELTLCEHHSSDARDVAPRFSPDSRRVFFQSDRDNQPAIYCVRVEKLVEETGESGMS
jgi:oligogalacturonide lyase